MDDPSSSLILPLYTLISICENALFFNKKPLDKMRRKGGFIQTIENDSFLRMEIQLRFP